MVEEPKIVRCKEFKWHSTTVIGMPDACVHHYFEINYLGDPKGECIAKRLDDLNFYCAYGEE